MAAHYQPPRAAFEPPAAPPSAEPLSIPPDSIRWRPKLRRRLRVARLSRGVRRRRPAFKRASAPSASTPAPVPRPPRANPRRSRDPRRPSHPRPRAGGAKADAVVAPVIAPIGRQSRGRAGGCGIGERPSDAGVGREFGRILKVVVSGVMDLLRARQQIKDEFRMRRRISSRPTTIR